MFPTNLLPNRIFNDKIFSVTTNNEEGTQTPDIKYGVSYSVV